MLSLITRAMTWAAALCLLALMLLTFVDVVGRSFHQPLKFQVEVVQILMGLTIAFGFAVTTLRGTHIAVDILAEILPEWWQMLLTRFAALTGVIFFTLVTWRLWDKGLDFHRDGLRTDILFLAVYPFAFAMALAAAVATVIAALQILSPNLGANDPDFDTGELDE